jgi:RNase P subunit RPR2
MREERKMICENCGVEILPAEKHIVLQEGGYLCVNCLLEAEEFFYDALEDEDEDEDIIQ